MKVSAALLCLLLTVATFSIRVMTQPDALNVLSRTCCFTFNNKKIALQKVQSYQNTSNQCVQKAVIFRTKLAKSICANPKEKWVQNYMKHLDQMSPTPRTSTLPSHENQTRV